MEYRVVAWLKLEWNRGHQNILLRLPIRKMEGNNGEITVFTNNRANENLKAYSEYKGIRGGERDCKKSDLS